MLIISGGHTGGWVDGGISLENSIADPINSNTPPVTIANYADVISGEDLGVKEMV
jgi:hypothetical protein